jgi:hypothetical protein
LSINTLLSVLALHLSFWNEGRERRPSVGVHTSDASFSLNPTDLDMTI